MRAEREHLSLEPEAQPRNYLLIAGGAGIAVLALLLYFGLRDSDAAPEAAPVPVVRDSAIVAPPVVDTPAAPAPVAQLAPQGTATTPRNFAERQLNPPVPTVGAGVAPVSERASGEALVIDGELLEELEEEAGARITQ